MSGTRWTAEQDAVLIARYAHERTEDIARDLGTNARRVYARARHLGLRKSHEFLTSEASGRIQRAEHRGRTAWFQKGLVPHNKGLRRPGYAPGRMAETQFKPGRPPQAARNYRPIGSLRMNKDGYLERKISDDLSIYPARRWAAVHRIVWEAAHGPVPPGHVVAFRPGRHTRVESEITLDRLELITRQQLMRRNSYHNYPKDIAQCIQLRGVLHRKIHQLTRTES